MSNKVVKKRRPMPGSPDPDRLIARVHALLAANDVPAAAMAAQRAVDRGADAPILLNLAAWRREEAGDFAGAHTLLARALAQAPDDVTILGAIATVMRKEGRLGEAMQVLDRVLAAEPRHAAAWLERGYTLDELRFDAAAADSYRRALSLQPGMAPALAKLADGAARRGESEEARTLAERARALSPAEPAAAFALATLAIEARDGVAAEGVLGDLLDAGVGGVDRVRALTLLGDALDRQDRRARAFATWQAANDLFRDIYRPTLAPQPDRPSHRAFIERIAAQVTTPVTTLPDATAVAGEAANHVFLLGYPRSGTTLVENVLASAPGVSALEERDTLADANGVLLAEDGAMPDLDAIDATELTPLREAYWRRVAGYGVRCAGATFVDMNPFNGLKLPIIARLFPRARILVMRRDPRDVILSCFRINFTPSTAAWCFSDLEEAARHYDALTGLTERCRDLLPLAYHDVRYDRLVSDFEPTVRAMAHFIGLEWTDDFRRFEKTARERGVRTASATQVRQGLYDGRGQWRRYEEQLAPALPILSPWVERFGFKG